MSLQQDSARVPNPKRPPIARTCPQCGGPLQYEGLTSVECLGRIDCQNFVPPKVDKVEDGTFDYARALVEHAAGSIVECQGEWDSDSVWHVRNPEHERVYGPGYRWRLSKVLDPAAPSPFAPVASQYPNGITGNWAWAIQEEADGRGATLEAFAAWGLWAVMTPSAFNVAHNHPNQWRHKP